MSESDPKETEGPSDPDEEGLESIPLSDEMEAAVKEAAESLEQAQAKRSKAQEGSSSGAPEAGSDDPESADKMTIELLSQELQNLKDEHEGALGKAVEAEDKLLRLQAEFENYRRRTLKEKQDSFKYGHQNLVKDLLATVDNLERAVAHGEENQDGDFQSLLQGVELVHKELLAALAKHGVEPIQAEDVVFDPAVHEAMAQVPRSDVPPNTVIDVLQTGYVVRDRMLRAARVVVSKAAEEEAQTEQDPEGKQ